MRLTPEEKETIIRIDETGAPAEIYTSSRRVADILMRRGVHPYRTEGNGWFFRLPRQAVILKPGKKSIRLARSRMASKVQNGAQSAELGST